MELVQKKLADYSVEGYIEKARSIQQRLPEIINGSEFNNELTRFLPTNVLDRTLNQSKFAGYLASENRQFLGQAIDALDGPASSWQEFEFSM